MNGVGVTIVKNLLITALVAGFGWVHNGLTTIKTKVALLEEQKREMKTELKEMKEDTKEAKEYLRGIIDKHEDDPRLHHALGDKIYEIIARLNVIESKLNE